MTRRSLRGFWDPLRLIDGPERWLIRDQITLRVLVLTVWQFALVVIVGIAVLEIFVLHGAIPNALVGLVLVGAGIWMLWQLSRWQVHVLTNQRILIVDGLWRRRYRSILLGQVQRIDFSQTPFDRMSGLGTVTITASGYKDELKLRRLSEPERFYKALLRHFGVRGGYSHPEAGPWPPADPPGRRPWWAPDRSAADHDHDLDPRTIDMGQVPTTGSWAQREWDTSTGT